MKTYNTVLAGGQAEITEKKSRFIANIFPVSTEEEAFEKLLGRIHPGAIVLLHSTSSTNAQILDELLTKWEEMGYQIRPLSDLDSL